MKKNITLLDCTFRDGGYYNNWNFSTSEAEKALLAICQSGINLVEIGYKSSPKRKTKETEGLFRYCTESQLQYLKGTNDTEFAFMIDVKEFLDNNQVDYDALKEIILPAEKSIFSWVRLASHFPTYDQTLEMAVWFKEQGYKVSANLMGISLLEEDKIVDCVQKTSTDQVDVFYFADSFGSLLPSDIEYYVSLIRDNFVGKIGFHAHDNQGMAFANALAALNLDVGFFDTTITGMGRGAGNLKTEQWLLYLYFNHQMTSLNPSKLLETIDTYFSKLQNKYQWGWDYTYMLSALKNIHPTYCQNLRSDKQFSIDQISKILSGIDSKNALKYNEETLHKAIDSGIHQEDYIEQISGEKLPLYKAEKYRKLLVIGTGPSQKKYSKEIKTFIAQQQPLVIECNPQNKDFKIVSNNYFGAILSQVRLKETIEFGNLNTPTITAQTNIPEQLEQFQKLQSVPCKITMEKIEISQTGISIPAYVVGMFAISLAVLSNPQEIYLVGFDGYEKTDPKNIEMEKFFRSKIFQEIDLTSLTPTKYSISSTPIYKLIN